MDDAIEGKEDVNVEESVQSLGRSWMESIVGMSFCRRMVIRGMLAGTDDIVKSYPPSGAAKDGNPGPIAIDATGAEGSLPSSQSISVLSRVLKSPMLGSTCDEVTQTDAEDMQMAISPSPLVVGASIAL